MPPEVNAAPGLTVSTRRPLQGGRYRLEFHRHACPQCAFHTLHAFLLLLFLVAEEETGREICDVVCSRCEPQRFARLQALAPSLVQEARA